MGNMSYCRFHNTVMDLQDCKDVLENGQSGLFELDEYNEKLSREEMKKSIELIQMCKEIAEQFEIYDEYELEEMWNNLKTK